MKQKELALFLTKTKHGATLTGTNGFRLCPGSSSVLSKFEIAGNSVSLCDENGIPVTASVGDSRSGTQDSPAVSLPVHLHHGVLFDGERFFELCEQNNFDSDLLDGVGSFSYHPGMEDLIAVKNTDIPFAENTVYTLCCRYTTIMGSDGMKSGIMFRYTDGSIEAAPAVYPGTDDIAVAAFSTTPGKTLEAVGLSASGTDTVQFYYEGFAFALGAVGKGTALPAYEGCVYQIALSRPLAKTGTAADRLNLLTGAVTRAVGVLTLSGESNVVLDNENGTYPVFRTSAPSALSGSPFSGTLSAVESAEELCETEFGFFTDEYGDLYFTLDSTVSGAEDAVLFLTDRPIVLLYSLPSPTYEYVSVPVIRLYPNDSVLDIGSAVAPSQTTITYT